MLLALLLIGSASAIGVFRKGRDAQVFSQPLFEQAGPSQRSVGDRDADLSFEYGASESATARPAVTASASVPDVDKLTNDLNLALSKRLSPEPALLEQMLALFAQRNQDPAHVQARAAILDALKDATQTRVPDVVLVDAHSYLAALDYIEPKQARLLQKRLKNALEREGKLSRAEHLLQPPFALERVKLSAANLRSVRQVDPENPRISRAVQRIKMSLIDQAKLLQQSARYLEAFNLLVEAENLGIKSIELQAARNFLQTEQAKEEAKRLDAFATALQAKQFDEANENILVLEKFLSAERISPLRQQIVNTELYGGFERGQTFSDALGSLQVQGPLMRVIPIGRFVMGSPNNETGRSRSEGPQRELTVGKGFALSQNEVTVGLFALFVKETNYRSSAERIDSSLIYEESSARMKVAKGVHWRNSYNGELAVDSEPVVHVSHLDATQFAAWLARVSGKPYRLMSEAEYEYVARAGSTRRYYWGNGSPGKVLENLAGEIDESAQGRRWRVNFADYSDSYFGPAPVGQFVSNSFGVYDIAGNVSEWSADCWHESYARAPESLQAWVNPGCAQAVVRGGNWGSSPNETRAATRMAVNIETSSGKIGFRVARDL